MFIMHQIYNNTYLATVLYNHHFHRDTDNVVVRDFLCLPQRMFPLGEIANHSL